MAMAELSKSHSVSELRTLRTNYRGRVEVAVAIYNAIQAKVLVYRGQNARSGNQKENAGRSGKLIGLEEALAIAQIEKEKLEAVLNKLDEEYRNVPKYGRKKDKAAGETTDA